MRANRTNGSGVESAFKYGRNCTEVNRCGRCDACLNTRTYSRVEPRSFAAPAVNFGPFRFIIFLQLVRRFLRIA